MLQNGWERIAKNLIQAISAGIVYTVSLRAWVPDTWSHIFSSFIVSIVILINIIDPVFENEKVLKRQGRVAWLSCIMITMFHEAVNNVPEQQWWQNASLVSLVGSCLVARLDYMIPYGRNWNNPNLRIKDKIVSIINSFGFYKALSETFTDDFTAVLCTSFIIVYTTVKFDKEDKDKRDNQERIALIVTLMSTIITMFLYIDINMYVSLIIGLGITNPLFTYVFEKISLEEEQDNSTDADSDEKSDGDIENPEDESDED